MNAHVKQLHRRDDPRGEASIRLPLLQEPLRSRDSDIPLIALLGAIGQYHTLRDRSHQERFGEPDSASRRALTQLQALERLLRDAGEDFVVDATLNIELSTKTL